MSTSAVGTVLDDIRAALILRGALTGVNVFSGPVSEEEGGQEFVWFGNATLVETPASMGGNLFDTWEISGEVWAAMKSWQGDTETTIKAARDRALAVFAQIEAHINDTYVGSYPDVTITAGELRQGVIPDGRRAAVNFTLTLQDIKNP